MTIDLEQIKKYYASVHDVKIEFIAKFESDQLSSDVIKILKSEIIKRNMDLDLLEMVDIKTTEISEKQLNELFSIIKNLKCPNCSERNSLLQGVIVRRVVSFLILTSFKQEPFISCQICSDKKINNSLIITSLFGWWGFPWGIIKTPYYIFKILRDKRNTASISNEILHHFINKNIAEIVLNQKNEAVLNDLLIRLNKYPETY
jgi:hypothetical protein